ncbi:hypothetical protein [Ferruginibacter sp. HRS2-29]|uniref:hypothetical protein n=1 Tax=Ferruginibacter sp. HRS2-29 TaxID=2487334 RepID=UPI0020CCF463|nr:hypothetical protein [Ferruginibacter sp. HRS2-29]
MPFRTFVATIVLKDGKIIQSDLSDPDKLYPKTFLKYFKQLIEKLVTDECQSGSLGITSKGDKMLIVTSGDLKKSRKLIVEKISEIFDVDIRENE